MEGDLVETDVESMEMDSVDRISELPEFILHDIMSCLDMKAACRAGVLSKRWQEAWSTIPVLDFQTQYFEKERSAYFVSFIDKTMDRYLQEKHSIRKLYIGSPAKIENLEPLLDRWVGIAVQNQVQELEIDTYDSMTYRLPEVLFSARSLKVLICNRVKLPNYGTMKLHSLEHLSLYNSVVDENMLQRIISFCPLIDLEFKWSSPLGDLSIPWMNRVSDNEVIEESGSNTNTRHSNVKTCSLRNLLYLNQLRCPWPFKMNVAALKNLRKLEIFDADITDDIVSELTSGLAVLQTLILNNCALLKYIQVSIISLLNFTVIACDLEKALIDAPNLVWFWINTDLELVVSAINGNGELKPALSIINVQDNCEAHLIAWVEFSNCRWFFKLKEFLIRTNVFKFLHINTRGISRYYQADVDEEQLQKIDSRPPYKLREFKLDETCNCELEKSSLSALLSVLFRSCHPDVLVIPTSFQNKTVEMILNILKEKVYNWKDPLKGIEFEGVNGSSLLSEYTLEIRFRLSW